MKKKIRNFFETIMILVIVLAFVMPVAATITKPTLSEEILEMSDAEFEWIPSDASGSHTIVGNEISWCSAILKACIIESYAS